MREVFVRFRKSTYLLLLAVVVLQPGPSAMAQDRVESEILIELMPGLEIDPVLTRYRLTLIDDIPQLRLYELAAPVGQAIDPLVDLLKNDPEVRRAEPHRRLETPEGTQRSVADLEFDATPEEFVGQIAGNEINAGSAHARYKGTRVTVAIIDTGIATNHPTLRGTLRRGTDFVDGTGSAASRPNGLDDDGDGQIDEGLHHATFVAGLVHLAAPNAGILPIRALEEDGRGTAFAVAKGILFAIDRGARVINLSFGMADDSRAVEKAIEAAVDQRIIVISSAGNDGGPVSFPAHLPQVIGVASVDANGALAAFSNFGPEIDVSAPGVDLLAPFGSQHFARWSGTSFSAPLVAGAAALILEKYPGLDGVAVRQLLQETASPPAGTTEPSLGAGILDLDALTLALTTDRTSLQAGKQAGGTVLAWSPVLLSQSYDVARGELARVAVVGETVELGPLVCVVNDSADTNTAVAADAETPFPGRVFFYVMRDDAPDAGAGSYGTDDSGSPRVVGSQDCPRSP